MTFGIAIPAYNNVESLRRCLDSIIRVAPEHSGRITICDDSGNGSIAASLRSKYPSVRWVIHTGNEGFGKSATDAVLANESDIVILLNDDVELLTNPVPALRQAFQDRSLFAVTFQSRNENDQFREGAKRLVWPLGMPRILHNEKDQLSAVQGILPSAYAVGGHAAYHRERFRALNGFDPLFDPFYWEDVDLSLRAAAKGWTTIYLPECKVKHHEHGAIRSSHKQAFIRQTTLRNRLLFAYRHLPKTLIPFFCVSVILRIAQNLFSSHRSFLYAWQAARDRRQDYRNDRQSQSTEKSN